MALLIRRTMILPSQSYYISWPLYVRLTLFCFYRYEWNESFNLEDFSESIDLFNDRERKGFTESYESIEWSRDDPIDVSAAARLNYGTSVEKALSKDKDIQIPLILKKKFAEFANTMILKALEEAGIKDCPPPLEAVPRAKDSDEERAYMWRLNDVLNWQMIDRRIDESV